MPWLKFLLQCYQLQIRWKSDIPLTEGQLKSKRDEFWDTAPAFEGKSEIWNALKAAVEATEVNDYDLAQGKWQMYSYTTRNRFYYTAKVDLFILCVF